jgi:hypothetical protein
MDIRPGQTVSVEIVRTPSNEAARKTLTRLFRRDPHVTRFHRRQKAKRPSWQTWRRGGRMWHHQMKSPPPVKLVAGQRYSVLATVDVLRDLESVGACVKVTPG